MPTTPADSAIFAPLFNVPAVAAIFSDEQFVEQMIAVEVALARVQGQLGLIPAASARAIATADYALDLARLSAGTESAGLPVISLLEQMRAQLGRPAADHLHWGATTQDIMDTAAVLQLRAAVRHLEAQLAATVAQLAALADRHRHTLTLGRTHGQQAVPLPFGFKVANWLAPLLRHRQRLAQLKPRLLVLQLSGAAGTLAPLGEGGVAVQRALAAELDLALPPIGWHTQRDGLAELGGWLSLLTASLAKMAQDIILLAQSEVAELRETSDENRGGSSTMPQKSNPVISEIILAAARTNASLLSALHGALIQEHERATHGWQVEWLTLPQMITLTAAALDKAHFLSRHLVVDEGRMAHNVRAANGLILAEAVSFALAPSLGRAAAKQLVRRAVQTVLTEGGHLVDVVRTLTDAAIDWDHLRDERNHFGSAEAFIDQVLAETGFATPSAS